MTIIFHISFSLVFIIFILFYDLFVHFFRARNLRHRLRHVCAFTFSAYPAFHYHLQHFRHDDPLQRDKRPKNSRRKEHLRGPSYKPRFLQHTCSHSFLTGNQSINQWKVTIILQAYKIRNEDKHHSFFILPHFLIILHFFKQYPKKNRNYNFNEVNSLKMQVERHIYNEQHFP